VSSDSSSGDRRCKPGNSVEGNDEQQDAAHDVRAAIRVGERSQPVKDLTACTRAPPERNLRFRG